MMDDFEQIIKDRIAKEFLFDKPEVALQGDEHLIRQGIVDSLGIFLLIGFLEKRFGIKIRPEDVVIENFATVKAIAALVMSKLSVAPTS